MNPDREEQGGLPLDPDCELLACPGPVRLGDVVRVGRHRLRVVRIVPGGALVRPSRWYDPIAIALYRLGLWR